MLVFFQNFSGPDQLVQKLNTAPVKIRPQKLQFHQSKILVTLKSSLKNDFEISYLKNDFQSAKKKSSPLSRFSEKHKIYGHRPIHRDFVRRKKMANISDDQIRDHTYRRFPNRSKRSKTKLDPSIDLSSTFVVDIDLSKKSLSQAIEELNADPFVEKAALVPIFETSFVNNNPYAFKNYEMFFSSGIKSGWNLTTQSGGPGFGQIVAVIDSGVDSTHPDLENRLVPGWNFIDENNDTEDYLGHGTHVAGIVAANNNSIGTVGIAWAAKVMPLKALTGTRGTFFDVAEAIVYAADNGADVINMSLGLQSNDPYYTSLLQNAVNYATTLGVVVVAAAGNSAIEVSKFIPASLDNVIAVSAMDSNYTLAKFSNFGQKIELTAPGVNVLSLNARYSLYTQSFPGYATLSGTSMASPHVAGLFAVLTSKYPNKTLTQLKSLINSSAMDLGETGRDPQFGFGLFDLSRAQRVFRENDFDGDRKSDIFWRNFLTGANVIWKNADSSNIKSVNTVTLPYKFPIVGDFNGDGSSDLFIRNSISGGNIIWLNANQQTVIPVTGVPDLNWKVKAVGDFDGDGSSDVFWRHSLTGLNRIWKGGNSLALVKPKSWNDFSWFIAGASDLDSDGLSDLLWRNSVTGENKIWKSANGDTGVQDLPAEKDLKWVIAGFSDLNGDGFNEILWQNIETKGLRTWQIADAGIDSQEVERSSFYGKTWQLIGIGDYDGNYVSDLLFRNTTTGYNIIWSGGFYHFQQYIDTLADFAWQIPPMELTLWGPSLGTPFNTKLLLAKSVQLPTNDNMCADWSIETCDGGAVRYGSPCQANFKYSTDYKTYSCPAPPSGTKAICPSVKLALELTYDDGTPVKCEGLMPASPANTVGVWGVDKNGTYGETSMTGPECISGNRKGSHYHTLSGISSGTCLSFCTLIADCNSTGQWKNVRYTW